MGFFGKFKQAITSDAGKKVRHSISSGLTSVGSPMGQSSFLRGAGTSERKGFLRFGRKKRYNQSGGVVESE